MQKTHFEKLKEMFWNFLTLIWQLVIFLPKVPQNKNLYKCLDKASRDRNNEKVLNI